MLIIGSGMYSDEKCTFCGEKKANGMWRGTTDIFVCKRCALDKLPQLMADTIVGGTDERFIQNSTGATKNITQEDYILKRFYSAFSSALLMKLRKGESEN